MTEQEKQAKFNELSMIATEYASDKATESALKKRIENNNNTIKALMELLDTDKVLTNNGDTVCYGITKRESLDEEKLIAQLHKYAPDTQCIKTKEYIDMDVLESEIYHDKLSDVAISAMNACKTVKEIPTLTIKKAKRGK